MSSTLEGPRTPPPPEGTQDGATLSLSGSSALKRETREELRGRSQARMNALRNAYHCLFFKYPEVYFDSVS